MSFYNGRGYPFGHVVFQLLRLKFWNPTQSGIDVFKYVAAVFGSNKEMGLITIVESWHIKIVSNSIFARLLMLLRGAS